MRLREVLRGRCTSLAVAATAGILLVWGTGTALAQDMAAQTSPPAISTMAPMPTMGAGLSVHDAWTRETPMIDLAAAAFMVIDNTTSHDDALIGASSPAADHIEIHQSAMTGDGMLAMSPVEAVPIPAGGTASLEPAGYHLMLVGLGEPLEAGTVIEITLSFAQSSPRIVGTLVRPMGPSAAQS